MNIDNYLRTPITIEQLVKFSQNELDMYAVYTKQDVKVLDEKTFLFLDEPIEVDDNDEEIYPLFARDNELVYYFFGDIVFDIISNTRYQLENPTIENYLANFNYYNKHDCFCTFSK